MLTKITKKTHTQCPRDIILRFIKLKTCFWDLGKDLYFVHFMVSFVHIKRNIDWQGFQCTRNVYKNSELRASIMDNWWFVCFHFFCIAVVETGESGPEADSIQSTGHQQQEWLCAVHWLPACGWRPISGRQYTGQYFFLSLGFSSIGKDSEVPHEHWIFIGMSKD